MFAEIRRIVDEDISIRVNQYDVIFEALTNAIHANATQIECVLNTHDNPISDGERLLAKKKVDSIAISDNGDGLNDHNYDSFCKYRSDHKKEWGCKGVGRFVFLKVYNYALYKSELFQEQEIRSFKFDFDFDTDHIKKQKSEVAANQTSITLTNLCKNYYNLDRNTDRRIDLDLSDIRNRALINLIPTLYFYKKKGVDIAINFKDATTSDVHSILPADIPDFKIEDFDIESKYGDKHKFTLSYHIENTRGGLHAFYCGNNRTVCTFSEKEMKISLPSGYKGFLLLESPYFDNRVNIERNDFTVFPIRTDIFSTLSWEIINEELKTVITKILKSDIPNTEALNKEKIQQISEERPYLTDYIEQNDIDIAGFIDKSQLIEKAKKRFDIAKENVLTNAGKKSYSNKELQEAINLAQNELVSYINDRVQVIERLNAMVGQKERVEAIIHNLLMQRHTDDNYFHVGKNNLWLLDDRFTTYSYAASDKRIKEVLMAIGEDADGVDIVDDKPDLSIFFSHNPEKPERLKSVLVEVKPFDYPSKSDRKKFAGIQQLIDYVEAFQQKERIEEVFAFLITDIDDKLAARLRKDDYTPLLSMENPMFHRFYKDAGISIYVISARALIKDAEARNKVFLDIIKKQSKIHGMLRGGDKEQE